MDIRREGRAIDENPAGGANQQGVPGFGEQGVHLPIGSDYGDDHIRLRCNFSERSGHGSAGFVRHPPGGFQADVIYRRHPVADIVQSEGHIRTHAAHADNTHLPWLDLELLQCKPPVLLSGPTGLHFCNPAPFVRAFLPLWVPHFPRTRKNEIAPKTGG